MREIKFRAWDKKLKQMEEVMAIDFDSEKVLCHPDYEDWRPFRDIELMQYTGLKDKNGKEIYEGDILSCDKYLAHKRWWRYTNDIPVIKKEVEEQKQKTHKLLTVCKYVDGCFTIFSRPISMFVRWNNNLNDTTVFSLEESGSTYNSDYFEGWMNIEVIGNIYENPELLK